MNNSKSVAALVPMRHHSERVAGKNFRDFTGKPLYAHIIETLLECGEVQKIIVDTDSPEITKGLMEHFPTVMVLDRPEHLRADDVPMNDVLLHDISQFPAQFYLQTHSTNPLLRSGTISNAIHTFFQSYPDYDSLFSVTALHTRLWNPAGKPINHKPDQLIRTQDLPPVMEENSCIYIFERETFQRRGNRLGDRPLLFEVDPAEAWDIDEELDFAIAEFLALRRGKDPEGDPAR